jgi:hypothetical protein
VKNAKKAKSAPARRLRASPAGDYVVVSTGGETVRAFVPHALPPDPPLELGAPDRELLERANLALGRLDGLAAALPDPSLFIYFYVRKEAVLSSQIEGTQSSFADLLLYESEFAPGAPLADVEEVSRYVAAMAHGLRRLRTDSFPLSLRLLREIHGVLLASGRGSDKTPGEFRRSQNWVGGARPGVALFVPPPSAWSSAWARWSCSCTTSPSAFRRCSRRRWPTCSLRRSIRFWTATGASAGC